MRKIALTDFRVATSETARDIYRCIILNLIRHHQPVPRADLSRHSGLQRSTVSAITEQLISKRWVTEGSASEAPRVRKPTSLRLNSQCGGIFGINVRPFVNDMFRQRSFAHAANRVIASGPAPLPRLRGILALVLQKRFGVPMFA